MSKVTIEFDNEYAAKHFMDWLCGSGEQEYWMWMEYREEDEDGDITALSFDYDTNKLEIKTECGRMDAD